MKNGWLLLSIFLVLHKLNVISPLLWHVDYNDWEIHLQSRAIKQFGLPVW